MKRGYSLAELLIGLSMMATLLAIAVPQYAQHQRSTQDKALRQDLYQVRRAVSQVFEDTGAYPVSLDELVLGVAPSNLSFIGTGTGPNLSPGRWRGPYLTKVPRDPVSGSAYFYSVLPDGRSSVTSSATGSDSRGIAYSTY